MAWIRTVPESEAEGIVRAQYDHVLRQLGMPEVPEIIKVFSERPDLLQARVAFQNSITFGGSGLGRYREELIATSISALLSCKF
jgi:hypothetical protein